MNNPKSKTVAFYDRLADGARFPFWEKKKPSFSMTYYVDNRNKKASDDNPGTKDHPFKTINHAAQILQPGERVVIATGVYREKVMPQHGGAGPDRMISFEAAPGASVVVKGSAQVDLKSLMPSTAWNFKRWRQQGPDIAVWELALDPSWFDGYNPFAIINILQDRAWLDHKKLGLDVYLKRRGMVFLDGKPLAQVEQANHLADHPEGAFWVEQHGQTLHIRFPNDKKPAQALLEVTTHEQVFAPKTRGLGYIRIKGISFEHAGNGFPVPQRGCVSAFRGHHWIIEDCSVGWANSVGIDIGNECWHASRSMGEIGHHIIRRTKIHRCGICGIAGVGAPNNLIEDNLIENIGFHDAELMYESGGVKFHHAHNLLFRRNVLRHFVHACGAWLDCGNVNCRIAGNVFVDISSRTGGFHFEGTHESNRIDHNIFCDIYAEFGPDRQPDWGGHGIYIEGSDRVEVYHNLIANCRCNGIMSHPVAQRIIDGRGGTARENRVFNNIITNCGQALIEFANEHNHSDGNLFSPANGGYLRIQNPEQRLDLVTWQEFHHLDKSGQKAGVEAKIDADKLTLELDLKDEVKSVNQLAYSDFDFFGAKREGKTAPGPFSKIPKGKKAVSIDPRKKE